MILYIFNELEALHMIGFVLITSDDEEKAIGYLSPAHQCLGNMPAGQMDWHGFSFCIA